jgi:hypothetical protein
MLVAGATEVIGPTRIFLGGSVNTRLVARLTLGALVVVAVALTVHLIPDESLDTPLGFTAAYALLGSIIPLLAKMAEDEGAVTGALEH